MKILIVHWDTYHKTPINKRVCFQCSGNSPNDEDEEEWEGDAGYDQDDVDFYLGCQQNEHDDTSEDGTSEDDASEEDNQDPDGYQENKRSNEDVENKN